MTPTEFLACKLWGWGTRDEVPPHRWKYDMVCSDGKMRYSDQDWPNFDPASRECPYWIREMEAKLAERGPVVWLRYVADVHRTYSDSVISNMGSKAIVFDRDAGFLAPPAARVSAAVKVLGGGDAK